MTLQILQITAVTISAIIAIVWFTNGWRRRKLLRQVREDWGRVRTASGIAWEYLLETRTDPPGGLDHQTWSDLDLDRVLPAVDRTTTWLGRWRLLRQISEHRAWHDQPDAEALAAEFGTSANLREAVGLELALAGSSVGSGLDLLTNPEVVRLRWWYWGFPLLPIAMLFASFSCPSTPGWCWSWRAWRSSTSRSER